MRVCSGTSRAVNKLYSTTFKCDIEVTKAILTDLIKNGFNVEYWENKNNCKIIVLDETRN